MKFQFFDDPSFSVPKQIKENRLILPTTPAFAKEKPNGDVFELAKSFLKDPPKDHQIVDDAPKSVPKVETVPRETQTELTLGKLSELEKKLHKLLVDKEALEEKANQGKKLQSDISELEKLLKKSQEQNTTLKQTVQDLRKDKTKIESNLKNQLDTSHQKQKSRVKSLENELEELKKTKKDLETQTSQLKKDLEKNKSEWERKVVELETGLKKEKKISEQEKNRNYDLENEVEKLKNEVENTKKETKTAASSKTPSVTFSLPLEESFETDEEKQPRNGDDEPWHSQYKGARKYKDLPDKQRIPGTKFELLPDAKQRGKKKGNSLPNSPTSPSSTNEISISPTNENMSEQISTAAADRQREKEEQARKKHEKQLEDMKEYYESEIADLEEKLKTQSSASQNHVSTHNPDQSLNEKNRLLMLKDQQILELQQKQIALPVELEKANAQIQTLMLELEKSQRGKSGKRFNPSFEPSVTENGFMNNPTFYPTSVSPFQPRPSMPVSPSVHLQPPGLPNHMVMGVPPPALSPMGGMTMGVGGGGSLTFNQHGNNYSHLSLEELTVRRNELKKEKDLLSDKLQRLPPGGHITLQDKRQRRVWGEKVEELQNELAVITKLLRKAEQL